MNAKEIEALKWCRKFANALTSKGLKAYFGKYWDGASGHDDATFWYFHPRPNGGVGAHVTYDGGTYDQGFLEPESLSDALAGIQALPARPSRAKVWKVLDAANAAWVKS